MFANDLLIIPVVWVKLSPSPWLTGGGSRMSAGPVRLKPRTSVVTSAEAELPFHGPTELLEDKLRVAEGHLARMWEEGAHE